MAGLKLILSPDEWRGLLASPPIANYLGYHFPADDHQLQRSIGQWICSQLPPQVGTPDVIVDWGYLPVSLADPESPMVLPSRRLAEEARDRQLAVASLLRAGGHHHLKLIATAWSDPQVGHSIVLVETDDSYVQSRIGIAWQALDQAKGDAIRFAVHHGAEDCRHQLDGLSRRRLGYPLHIDRPGG